MKTSLASNSLEILARRRSAFRMMQLSMLLLLGLFFLLAALAQPVFGSVRLGWEALSAMIVAFFAFWWAGHQADRRC